MATCVFGEESKEKLGTVQFCNSTVKRRIQDMSADTDKQLMSRLKSRSAFPLHLEKKTDVTDYQYYLH
jgi:hypothetical protein